MSINYRLEPARIERGYGKVHRFCQSSCRTHAHQHKICTRYTLFLLPAKRRVRQKTQSAVASKMWAATGHSTARHRTCARCMWVNMSSAKLDAVCGFNYFLCHVVENKLRNRQNLPTSVGKEISLYTREKSIPETPPPSPDQPFMCPSANNIHLIDNKSRFV